MQKTKKAIAKRFRSRGNGLVYQGAARMRHNLRRRTQDAKRQSRSSSQTSSTNMKLLRRCAPHGIHS